MGIFGKNIHWSSANVELVVDAPADVTARVKARVHAAVKRSPTGQKFAETFPKFMAAVEALPKLDGFLLVVQELRPIPLDGYRDEGVKVPREIWEALGCGQFYKEGK